MCFKERQFLPSIGRFLSRDKAGFVDGVSLYVAYFAGELALDPFGTLKVFLWNPHADAYGHAALELCDKTYIRWWPTNVKKSFPTLKRPGTAHPSLQSDITAEGNVQPTYTIDLGCNCFDEAAISKWFADNYTNNANAQWGFLVNNCSTVAAGAMAAGAGINPCTLKLSNTALAATPFDVRAYAECLQRWCNSKRLGTMCEIFDFELELTRDAVLGGQEAVASAVGKLIVTPIASAK